MHRFNRSMGPAFNHAGELVSPGSFYPHPQPAPVAEEVFDDGLPEGEFHQPVVAEEVFKDEPQDEGDKQGADEAASAIASAEDPPAAQVGPTENPESQIDAQPSDDAGAVNLDSATDAKKPRGKQPQP
jgi:hypothetical protein